jgi:hypothetical protein
LRPALYVRYVDDFLLFGNDKAELGEMKRRMEEFLSGLRLRIHPGKSRVYRTADGVTFLGWRIFPGRLRLERGNVVRFRRRLGRIWRRHAEGRAGWGETRAKVRGWIAHAAHGDTWRLRRRLFSQYRFGPRSAVSNGVARGFVEQ